MGRQPELGLVVHLARADLHLDGLAFGAQHRGVDRAVEIVLGRGDVVVELAGNVRPAPVHQAERRVAVRHRGGHDAHRAQVEHLLEGQLLAVHLPVDAVDVLGPAVHLARDAGGPHHVFDRAAELDDVLLAVDALFRERRGDAAIVVGLQEAERQVLELPLELPESEPIGQRREHFARLERQPFARGRVAVLCGGEIDQLPRQPRQHQARIADHGQQHLAQRLGLRGFEVMRGRRHGCQPDVAEMRELARERA